MAQVFSRLLLATEHSDFDSGAESLAFALARRCGAPLAGVLPIVSNAEFESVAPQLAERAEQQAAERLHALATAAERASVALTMRARRGPEPYVEIVEEAVQQASDLIIIRRRGRRGFLANLLVGEMVSKVVAHAPCSVLIAPRDAHMWTQRVIVAIDPRAPDAGVVALAAAVARECGLPLTLVAVSDHDSAESRSEAEAALFAMVQVAVASGAEADSAVRFGRAHEEIVAAAAAHGAGLVVIGRHGQTRLGRAWLGGVTQRVIGLADRPVLVAVTSNPKEAR